MIDQEIVVSTPQYLAPEILNNKNIGPEADWYSLGALIFEMLSGSLPATSEKN